jgi:hypothetical protein
LIGWGWEYVQPYIYRQTVDGERRDIKIVDDDGLQLRWYREEVARSFGPMAPSPTLESGPFLSALLSHALVKLPVFVDLSAAGFISGNFGLVDNGIVAELAPGTQITSNRSLTAMSLDLNAVQERDGWIGKAPQRFPNRVVSLFEMRADLLVAALAESAGLEQLAANEIETATRIRPDIKILRTLLAEVQARNPHAQQDILGIAITH